MNYDAYGNPIKPRGAGLLVPLLIALFASAGGNYWLWKERSRLSADANTATAKASALEAMQKEMTERLAKLEAERSGLIEEKEQAVKDAQAKATELAKLKDDVAGVEVEKEPEKADEKAKAKESATKGDKKADAKAEAKAKAKAKAKKKAEARKKESGDKNVEREL